MNETVNNLAIVKVQTSPETFILRRFRNSSFDTACSGILF